MDKNSSELAALFIIDNFDKISGPMKCWNIMMDISPQNVSKWSFKTNTDGYCFYVATYQLLKLLNNGDEGSFWKEQSVIDNSDIILVRVRVRVRVSMVKNLRFILKIS